MSEIHRGEDLVGITMIGVKGYGVSVEGMDEDSRFKGEMNEHRRAY